MRAVQALKHRQRASDLHFFHEDRLLGVIHRNGLDALLQVISKSPEVEMQLFDGVLSHVENVVHSYAIRPRFYPAAKTKLSQPRDDANQDFLSGILRIFS